MTSARGSPAMKPRSCLFAGALVAVGLLQSAFCVAQTPEQQKLWDAQRAQAQELLKGGGRLDPAHQLPIGLEKEIESASRALVPATRVLKLSEGRLATSNEPVQPEAMRA